MTRLPFWTLVLSLTASPAAAFAPCSLCAATVSGARADPADPGADAAIRYVSEQLDLAFEIFRRTMPRPSVNAAARDTRRIRTQLFRLTVLHWLQSKQALCSCETRTANSDPSCARLPEEHALSCGMEPRPRHGPHVRCMTKGR